MTVYLCAEDVQVGQRVNTAKAGDIGHGSGNRHPGQLCSAETAADRLQPVVQDNLRQRRIGKACLTEGTHGGGENQLPNGGIFESIVHNSRYRQTVQRLRDAQDLRDLTVVAGDMDFAVFLLIDVGKGIFHRLNGGKKCAKQGKHQNQTENALFHGKYPPIRPDRPPAGPLPGLISGVSDRPPL